MENRAQGYYELQLQGGQCRVWVSIQKPGHILLQGDCRMDQSITVLIVEDDPDTAFLCQHMLVEAGFEVVLANSLTAAVQALESVTIDVILLDLSLPESPADNTLQAIPALRDKAAVIVLTASNDPSLGLRSMNCGADRFLNKSDMARDMALLPTAIKHAAAHFHYHHQVKSKAEEMRRAAEEILALLNKRKYKGDEDGQHQ